ncbi:MAG: YdcF family protein [Clostridiales bacterium]|nr:YdcF family protein [Clostridiales bacterium]
MSIIDDITDFIFVEHRPRESAIILLPGGSDPAPPEAAAQLYRRGLAPLLLPSGGVSVKLGRFRGVRRKREVYGGDYATDCAFYTDVLIKNGVPARAIVPEDASGHTRDNAFFSRRAADERGLSIQSALICCKSFHARRCLMLYQLAFPEAALRVVPVDVYGIDRYNWHQTEAGIDRVLGELARCGNQFSGDFKAYLARN